MLDLLSVLTGIVDAIALLAVEGLFPWLALAAVVVAALFLLRASIQAAAKALRRRERAARRRELASMVRLSRVELFRLQSAWATIERTKTVDPNAPGYAEVQDTWRQALGFVQTVRTLAASQGKRVPESSAECLQVLWFWESEEFRARKGEDTGGSPDAAPVRPSRASTIARLGGGLSQRLRAGAPQPGVIVAGVSGLLGGVLVGGVGHRSRWEAIGLAIAGGLIGAALARWGPPKAQQP